MVTPQNFDSLIGENLHGSDGSKIGKISDIYLDEQTNQPEWFAVTTGFFGTRVSFCPIQGMQQSGGTTTVPYTADKVKNAPQAEADGALSQQEEAELYAYYGLSYSEANSDSGLASGNSSSEAGIVGRDTSGPTTDTAMTRSEEELRVSTQTSTVGKARLRKYLVTEQQSVTVPVTREEVRIEREPITDANIDAAMSGPELSEEEHEVTLHAEEAVVETRVVPKERVRLATDEVVEEETVSADLTKERIDIDGDVDTTNKR